MPCQLLIAATTHRKQTKGEMLACRDEPTEWGGKEGPPNYVVVRIKNANAAQIEQFLRRWKTNFAHSVSTLPDLSKQITVTISPRLTEIFGTIQGLRLQMKTHLEDQWGAAIVSYNSTQAVFNVPADTDLAALKADILDEFEEQVGPRWLFSSADVDTALAAGGFVEVTKAQAQARIVDRTA